MKKFNIQGVEIDISDDIKKIAELSKQKIYIAFEESENILIFYDDCSSIEKFVTDGRNACANIAKNILELAVKQCVSDGYYDIDEESFVEIDANGTMFNPLVQAIGAIEEAYDAIVQNNEDAHEYRRIRKEGRGRFIGGGFGISGAISGSLKAGALNMATGLAHSAFNAVGNAISSYETRKQLKALYENPDCEDILLNAVRDTVDNVWNVMITNVYNLEISDSNNIKTVNSIIKNVAQNRIPEDKKKGALLNALKINPLETKIYKNLEKLIPNDKNLEKLRQYLYISYIDAFENVSVFVKNNLSLDYLLKKIKAETGTNDDKFTFIKECITEEETIEEGVELLAALIKKDYLPAVLYYADLAAKNKLSFQDPESAMVVAYEKAAQLGHKEAYRILGDIFRKGNDAIHKDETKAVKYYEKAFENGIFDVTSYNYVIYAYIYGKGVQVNYEKSLWYIQQGLENVEWKKPDYKRTLVYLKGKHYYNGWGVSADIDIAVNCFKDIISNDINLLIDYAESWAIIELCELAHKNDIQNINWNIIYDRVCNSIKHNKVKDLGVNYAKGLMLEYGLCSERETLNDIFDLYIIYKDSKYIGFNGDLIKTKGRANYILGLAFEKYLPDYADIAFQLAEQLGYKEEHDKFDKRICLLGCISDEDTQKIALYESVVNESIATNKLSPFRCEAIVKCCRLAKMGYEVHLDWQKVYDFLFNFSFDGNLKEPQSIEERIKIEDKIFISVKNAEHPCVVTGMNHYCMGMILEYKLCSYQHKIITITEANHFSEIIHKRLDKGCLRDVRVRMEYNYALIKLEGKDYPSAKKSLEEAKKIANDMGINTDDIDAQLQELSDIAVTEDRVSEPSTPIVEKEIFVANDADKDNEPSKFAMFVIFAIFSGVAYYMWDAEGFFGTIIFWGSAIMALGAFCSLFETKSK